MKISVLFFLTGVILLSCSEGKMEKQTTEQEILMYPKEIFSTVAGGSLPSDLQTDLETEKFAIEKTEKESSYSEFDGDRKVNVVLQGKGITKYYVKRQEAKPEGYYPDFVLYVFDLKDKKAAAECFAKLTLARFSPGLGEERIKDVETMTQNRNQIFILSTRGEIFRPYITDFAKKISKY